MNQNQRHHIAKQFTLALLIILSALVLYSLHNFIDAFLGAVIIYILFRPMMRYLTLKLRWNKSWSSVLVILITILAVVLPGILVVKIVLPRVAEFFNHPEFFTQSARYIDEKITALTGVEVINEENLQNIQSTVAGYATSMLNQTFNAVTDLGIMFFILYFMLQNTGAIEKFLEQNLPMPASEIQSFGKELQSMTISNVLGAPILATAQGLIAVLGYWICGLPDPLLWGLVTGVFSFMPIIGSALVWIPAALYLLSTGHTWQPIGLLIIGIIIGFSDNVIRFGLQKSIADVHPLVTVLGVITGFFYFGLPGIIFGPLLISWLMILFKIFQQEYIISNNKN